MNIASDSLSPRQMFIVFLIYGTAILPWIGVIIGTFLGKMKHYVIKTMAFMTLVAAFGWELWFNYGILSGMSVEKRRPTHLNAAIPIHINWLLNSLCDGSICLIGIWLLPKIEIKNKRTSTWSWKSIITVLLWFVGQNVFVEMVIYSGQLQDEFSISWAPLSPLGPWINPTLVAIGQSKCRLQAQIPWLFMLPIFFSTLQKFSNDSISKIS